MKDLFIFSLLVCVILNVIYIFKLEKKLSNYFIIIDKIKVYLKEHIIPVESENVILDIIGDSDE